MGINVPDGSSSESLTFPPEVQYVIGVTNVVTVVKPADIPCIFKLNGCLNFLLNGSGGA